MHGGGDTIVVCSDIDANSVEKKYNALAGTSPARLKRKDAWMAHAEVMQNGLTIRESAKIADVDVITAFQ